MRIAKHIFISVICVLASALIGLGLLILVYMLPTAQIKANINRGSDVLLVQTTNYNYAGDYKSTVIDNFTDSLILNELFYETDNPIVDAVNVPNYSYPDKEILYSTMAYLNGDPVPEGGIELYPRYWHGYAVVLKTFFMFFDYTDLKIFNQAVQFILILIIVLLMMKQKLAHYMWGFIMMIIYWNPATIGVSIQLSSCFYISMIASIIVLFEPAFLFRSENRKANTFLFFLMIGVVTCFFDFLTYPLATLAVPYVFYLLIRYINEIQSIKDTIIDMVSVCAHWAFGYVTMWTSKWFLATIITGNNIFMDAYAKITERSSTTFSFEDDVTRWQVVVALVRRCVIKWPYIILFAITFLVCIYMYRECFHNIRKNVLCSKVVALLLMGLSPFVWIYVVANHSYIHNGLVCRIMGITIFSWYCMLISLVQNSYTDREAHGGSNNE